MHWYFERDGLRMRWEIRREDGGTGYELILNPPGGPEAIERFDDPAALIQRSLTLQQALLDAGWRSPHTPRDPGD
jgi:hypothetical protein